MLAVGAFDESDLGHDDLESFSSLGPSRIYFPTVEARAKPDVVATDGVSVTGSGGFSSHFFGTSAAAPHVAGIAALLIEAQRLADPSMTKKAVADAVTKTIRDTAIDLGDSGHDAEFGYGRADALAAVDSIGQYTATTFTVDSTGDGSDGNRGDGVCNDGAGHCTLRAAIQEANLVNESVIEFNISGSGTQTIQPGSAFPTVAKKVFIDGFSQPGAGSNSFRIELDGTNAGTGTDGLKLTSESTRVRGLVINRFDGNGIVLQGSSGQLIEENRIGTNVSGTADLGNGKAGVSIVSTPGVVLRKNLISGNDSHGVSVSNRSSSGVLIDDNIIGANASETSDLGTAGPAYTSPMPVRRRFPNNTIAGNDSHGVALTGAQTTDTQVGENHIGTNESGGSIANGGSGVHIGAGASENEVRENVIAHNAGDGVTIVSRSAEGNTVRRNSMHSNSGLGIDLADDGVTRNDSDDTDSGPNNLQNYPTLTAAGLSADAGSIEYGLVWDKAQITLDFYASESCDGSGSGEGRNGSDS